MTFHVRGVSREPLTPNTSSSSQQMGGVEFKELHTYYPDTPATASFLPTKKMDGLD